MSIGNPGFTKSSGNVFEDLDLPNPEEHLEKSKIVAKIQGKIESSYEPSYMKAASQIGISEEYLIDIVRGKFSEVSKEDLESYLSKLD